MSAVTFAPTASAPDSVTSWRLVSNDPRPQHAGVVPLEHFPARVGREPGSAVLISNLTVSTLHAEISRVGERLAVRDLCSRNGTFVNGNKIEGWQELSDGDLLQFGEVVYRLQSDRVSDRGVTCVAEDSCDLALALAQFDKLLSEEAVTPYYQPIVACRAGGAIGYEALGRSRLFGLNLPAMMFRAAAHLNKEADLSRMLRRTALESNAAEQHEIFVNTHPSELLDPKSLIRSLILLRQARPNQPLTVEIHEASVADMATMKLVRLVLDDLDMKLAYDDFGAGQARLVELVEARPDYLKFDMKLIRGIDQGPGARQTLLASLVKISRDLGITTLAEGVETSGEQATCQQMGFDLLQGYLFGRPAAGRYYLDPGR
jgi:EAL domain-containing protein (putative c-di-GMP-specific phosphodiesterase class I)